MAKKQKTENTLKPAEVLAAAPAATPAAVPEVAESMQNASGLELVMVPGGTHRLHDHDTGEQCEYCIGPHGSGYNPVLKRTRAGIKWIVVHYTGTDGVGAAQFAKSFARNGLKKSTHFFVDDGAIVTSLPLDRVAWHIGDGRPCEDYRSTRSFSGYDFARRNALRDKGCTNASAVSIDLCSHYRDGAWSVEGVKNAALLVRWLMRELQIDIDHVVTHRHCTGKPCPQPWAADPSLFAAFKKALKSKIKS